MTIENGQEEIVISEKSPLADSKVKLVKAVFENAPRYLNSRRVDIRVRTDTIRGFVTSVSFARLLDVGCGDGTISLQLAKQGVHLTLLDVSANMAERARCNTPLEHQKYVEIRNEDFMAADLKPRAFDLIISVGVLAHVDSPKDFLDKVSKLSTHGGYIVLEFTDAWHPVGLLEQCVAKVQELFAPAKYSTNKLGAREVMRLIRSSGLKVVSTFRYANVPGMEIVGTSDWLYRTVRMIFGRVSRNRMAWLGNQYICLLQAE